MASVAPQFHAVSAFAVSPPIPIGDRQRVAAVRALELLDTPAEERFDRITRLACRVFGVRTAAVTLVDADRTWVKSGQNVGIREAERSSSFCAHAIAEDRDLVVEDAARDERFRNNRFVVAEGGIRFYAGHRLVAPDGHAVGALCIVDQRPRAFAVEDRYALRDLALIAEQELAVSQLGESQRALARELDEARRSALIDGLTDAWNRRAMDEILEREFARARREGSPLTVAMIDVDHFKRVNDLHGHPAGDAVIRGVAARLRGAVRVHDAVGRYGGEEFMVVLGKAGPQEAAIVGERIRAEIARTPISDISVTASIGIASLDPADPEAVTSALVAAADRALYRAKHGGRNRVCGP